MTTCRHKAHFWRRHDGTATWADDTQAVRQHCLYCDEVRPFGEAVGGEPLPFHTLPERGRHHDSPGGWSWDPTRPVAGQYEEWIARLNASSQLATSAPCAVCGNVSETGVACAVCGHAPALLDLIVAVDAVDLGGCSAESPAIVNEGPAAQLLEAAGGAGVESLLMAASKGSNAVSAFSQKVLSVPHGLDTAGAVILHLGDATWHDGPGWYYTVDACPDAGSCGAFANRSIAEAHARMCGYTLMLDVAPADLQPLVSWPPHTGCDPEHCFVHVDTQDPAR